MLLKNLKSYLKHLSRNKLYAMITLFGFAVSLMFVILLSVYIRNERSVDSFHANKENLYRLAHDEWSGFAPPTGQMLIDNYPEMQAYSRIFYNKGFASVKEGEKVAIDFQMADSAFFTMFSFELLQGDKNRALAGRMSIVPTKSFALKLFGRLPELGETVEINGSHKFQITGIMEDWPENTQFIKTDAVIDFPSLATIWDYPDLLTSYDNNSFSLFVMAKPGTNLPSKAPQILEQFKKVNWMYERGTATEVVFEPITESYFSSSRGQGIEQNNPTQIKVLSLIVLLILGLSIINYINLTVTQSSLRAKEIAVKKLMGGKQRWFFMQYINESVLMGSLSMILAILLSFLAEPVFNRLTDTDIRLSQAFDLRFMGFMFLITLITGFISGIIPALKISAFNPIAIVKGSFRLKEQKLYSRIMVTSQYLIIISLLVSAFVINKQTRHMRNYDLGYNKENIIVIDAGVEAAKEDAFRSRLKTIPGVEAVSFVQGSPIDGGNNNSFEYNGKPLSFQVFGVDSAFFRMMGMTVLPTGMAYSDSVYWINEAGIKALELEPDAKSWKIWNQERPIYGIVKNFNYRNLHTELGPAFFFVKSPKSNAWSILVKVKGINLLSTRKEVMKAYGEFTGGVPVDVVFMDEEINRWYESEEKLGTIIFYFTLLTVIISVMGLFAMSLYYVSRKNKEIGIRKVNGAEVSEVLSMLNKDFVLWVVVAFAVAAPLSWYAMNRWLEGFPYKTTLNWWIFLLAGAIALVIALLTVSWQSWRAATRNPVEALRYE